MNTAKAVRTRPVDYDPSPCAPVAAFITDPLIRWMFPDPWPYLDYFPLVVKYLADGSFERSSEYRCEKFGAAALTLPGFAPLAGRAAARRQ
jgi:hypothetical protein